MNKIVELPLIEPMYSTYHNGIASAILAKNPSIRNWYLNEVMLLQCGRMFLSGFTTPKIDVVGCAIINNPYIDRKILPMVFLKGCINKVIRNLIDEGYYVHFTCIDDYYVQGKSWYKTRHFKHDGAICGYNQSDKTYCIYAYDKDWIYQKFWTPQSGFNKGRSAMFKEGIYGKLYAVKPKMEEVIFAADIALNGIEEYLDSNFEKYPEDGEGKVYGIIVHAYIAKYVEKLFDGSIPYERMDWRVFRLIWEHKKVMLQRIQLIEQSLEMDNEISKKYQSLVKEADMMRMLYASHHMKRRDACLPVIQNKLLMLMENERELLTMLVKKARKDKKNESVEVSQE